MPKKVEWAKLLWNRIPCTEKVTVNIVLKFVPKFLM